MLHKIDIFHHQRNKYDCGMIVAVAVVIVSSILAYSNTFSVPFLFDDKINIVENRSIHQLWPPWYSFNIPIDTGIVGRPVINFSFAVNYAISGGKVWSYHLLNLIIHILSALTLMALIRRTISTMDNERQYFDSTLLFSFVCALLWALHPVQTQAVTYVSQRCESLMALLFLLTFYCAMRGWKSPASRVWHLLAIAFFLLSASSKEVAVVVPFLVLLYEWTFRKKNPVEALKAYPAMYSGFALVVIFLMLMVVSGGTLTSRTANNSFTPLDYWITQCQVILHYVRLSIWPSSLTIDYGWPVAAFKEAWLHVIIVVFFVCMSLWSLWRQKVVGFLGMWFFIIIAPTSLFPLPDLAFEHRLYLSLAAIIIAFVGIVYNVYFRLIKRFGKYEYCKIVMSVGLTIAIICINMLLGFMTYKRNNDYRSEMAIWLDTVNKRPDNFRGYHGVGLAFASEKEFSQGLEYMLRALKLNPQNPYVNTDTGFILFLMKRPKEAIPYFEQSIKLKPNNSKAQNNLGAALAQTGNLQQAIVHFSRALEMKPDYTSARNNLEKASASLKQSTSDDY